MNTQFSKTLIIPSSPPISPQTLDLSEDSLMFDLTEIFQENDNNSNCISPWDIYSNKINNSQKGNSWQPWNNEIKPALVGAGLANLGNTCFLNAVLQCLTHTVPVVQGLRSLNHNSPCDKEDFCLICVLCNHVELSLVSTGKVVSPLGLVDNLSYFSMWFQRYQQEDAHEFLQCLLDRLESCCVDLKKSDDNIVKSVFGGRLVSKLRCCSCGYRSDTYESLIDLSLEIDDVRSLESALESFTKVEKIDDPETKFTCEECKEEVSLEKQFVLDQTPSVMAFHLKRFKSDGSYVEKIDKHVEYSMELNLLPYTSRCMEDKDKLMYELYAIVVHNGVSSTSGHYFCFVRSSPGTWYKLDDSKVTRVEEESVLCQEAYILFYAKQGTPWCSSLIEAQKQRIDSNTSSSSPRSVLDSVDSYTTHTVTENIYRHGVHESGDAEQSSAQLYSQLGHAGNEISGDKVEFREGKGDGDFLIAEMLLEDDVDEDSMEFAKMLMGANENGERTSSVVKKEAPSSPGEKNCNEMISGIKNNADILPRTPPRSSSPDIYLKESPDNGYHIPQQHLRSENRMSSKRALDKSLEDTKKREALKTLKLTSMPTSRRMKLMAVMQGSPIKKKNKERARLSPFKKVSPPSACRKPRHKDVTLTPPMATAIFR